MHRPICSSVLKTTYPPPPCRSSPTLTPFRAEGRDKTAKHCLRDKYKHGTEAAIKVVRQARLELSGGSTPDQLRPPPLKRLLLTDFKKYTLNAV